jgi:hypothetical protein
MVTHNTARKAYNKLFRYCDAQVDCSGCIFNGNGCRLEDIDCSSKMTKEEMNETLTRLESEKENS